MEINNNNIEELKKGYEKYLKIKQRTNECSKKWIKEHKENARKNNKTYYDKIKLENPEKYNIMLKKKAEQKRIRDLKKKKEDEMPQALAILYNV
jgi:hypothetical protein